MPVTARAGVLDHENWIEFTVVGVIFPRARVIAGVEVAFATVPDIPLAVTTDTVVTVPVPPAGHRFIQRG